MENRSIENQNVLICMPIYRPDLKLLKAQLDSIIAQSHKNWKCILLCDGDLETKELLAPILRFESRFRIESTIENHGVWTTVENLLKMSVKEDVDFIALADQDDIWHKNKIAEQIISLLWSNKKVTSCDSIITTTSGKIVRNGLRNRSRFITYSSLLLANEVSGASLLMRREFVGISLPFPGMSSRMHHDHYLALLAFRMGELHLSNFKLYNWVQHEKNLSGDRTLGKIQKIRMNLQRLKLSNAAICVQEIQEYHKSIEHKLWQKNYVRPKLQFLGDFLYLSRHLYFHTDLFIGFLQFVIVKLKPLLSWIIPSQNVRKYESNS
jgi:glycosyltransferase involved in cell wall biosynthesis